jgi:plasmid stability protein
MTQITIRRLDAAVVQGLKNRAAAAGHSMEQEARKILEAAVLPSREGIADGSGSPWPPASPARCG